MPRDGPNTPKPNARSNDRAASPTFFRSSGNPLVDYLFSRGAISRLRALYLYKAAKAGKTKALNALVHDASIKRGPAAEFAADSVIELAKSGGYLDIFGLRSICLRRQVVDNVTVRVFDALSDLAKEGNENALHSLIELTSLSLTKLTSSSLLNAKYHWRTAQFRIHYCGRGRRGLFPRYLSP